MGFEQGTSAVGEHASFSWLWWVVLVVVGLFAVTFLVAVVMRRFVNHTEPRRGLTDAPEARLLRSSARSDAER